MGVRADDQPIRIHAVGSLAEVMPKLIAASGLPPTAVAPPTHGPAGMLRQRLLDGVQADLRASADLARPRTVSGSTDAPVVPFALVSERGQAILAASGLLPLVQP